MNLVAIDSAIANRDAAALLAAYNVARAEPMGRVLPRDLLAVTLDLAHRGGEMSASGVENAWRKAGALAGWTRRTLATLPA